MAKYFYNLLLLFVLAFPARAEEGLFLLPDCGPFFSTAPQEGELTAGRINSPSFYSSVVRLRGRGTGTIVSPDGLILTVYENALPDLYSLADTDDDIFTNGFWASEQKDEIPIDDLAVLVIRYMEDVTDFILEGVSDTVSIGDFRENFEDKYNEIFDTMFVRYPGGVVGVERYYSDNRFILSLEEIFFDVRLVGVYPAGVGEEYDGIGGFAFYRIYTGSEGGWSATSPENVPLGTPDYVKISPEGFRVGEPSVVLGYPGYTARHLTVAELVHRIDANPHARSSILKKYLPIVGKRMSENPEIRRIYLPEYHEDRIRLECLLAVQESLTEQDIFTGKLDRERQFIEWASELPERAIYLDAYRNIVRRAEERSARDKASVIQWESLRRLRMPKIAVSLSGDLRHSDPGDEQWKRKVTERMDRYFMDYDEAVERELAETLFRLYTENVAESYRPDRWEEIAGRGMKEIYDTSYFSNREKAEILFLDPDENQWREDPGYILGTALDRNESKLRSDGYYRELQEKRQNYRMYFQGLKRMGALKYPDGDHTLRVSFGKILSPPAATEIPHTSMQDADATEKVARIPRIYTDNDIAYGMYGGPVLDRKGYMIGMAIGKSWNGLINDIVYLDGIGYAVHADIRDILRLTTGAGGMRLVEEIGGSDYLKYRHWNSSR